MKRGFTLVKSWQEQEWEQAQKLKGPNPNTAPNMLLAQLFASP